MRRVVWWWIIGVSSTAIATSGARAQSAVPAAAVATPWTSATPAQAEFIEIASGAAARYRDQRAAIADGYKRLGPDFPGMGAHWVHMGRVISRVVVADEPSVLDYVDVDGVPTLVAVAYTVPLGPEESPPAEPFGEEVWHDHSGAVNEESLLLNHPSSASVSATGFRISMIHVWVPLSNPAGVLEQNNWKLPFLRAGLHPPTHPSSLAGRGLSLGSRESDYYAELFYWAGELNPLERRHVDAVLSRYRAVVDSWIDEHRGEAIEQSALVELEVFWTSFWDELEESLGAEAFARIRPLREGHE